MYGFCFTEWTTEFMGSYSNYKLNIPNSVFNRMSLWRTLCLQEEVLCLSFFFVVFLFMLRDKITFIFPFPPSVTKLQEFGRGIDGKRNGRRAHEVNEETRKERKHSTLSHLKLLQLLQLLEYMQ